MMNSNNKPVIEFINHASVLISNNEISLLSDPWFQGDAFHKGWNLLHELNDAEIKEVLSMLEEALPGANIKRIDQDDSNFSIVALVKIQSKKALLVFCGKFQEKFPQGKFSIIDDSVYPNE